jgi:hypothetical protein
VIVITEMIFYYYFSSNTNRNCGKCGVRFSSSSTSSNSKISILGWVILWGMTSWNPYVCLRAVSYVTSCEPSWYIAVKQSTTPRHKTSGSTSQSALWVEENLRTTSWGGNFVVTEKAPRCIYGFATCAVVTSSWSPRSIERITLVSGPTLSKLNYI